MVEKVKKYWDAEGFLNEVTEHIEVQTSDGKYVIFKRLTKGEDSVIRKKTMKMIKTKGGIQEPQIDSEEYQILLLTNVLIKPKLTEKDIRESLSGQRADELFMLYSQEIGFGNVKQNL